MSLHCFKKHEKCLFSIVFSQFSGVVRSLFHCPTLAIFTFSVLFNVQIFGSCLNSWLWSSLQAGRFFSPLKSSISDSEGAVYQTLPMKPTEDSWTWEPHNVLTMILASVKCFWNWICFQHTWANLVSSEEEKTHLYWYWAHKKKVFFLLLIWQHTCSLYALTAQDAAHPLPWQHPWHCPGAALSSLLPSTTWLWS